ncbi:type IV pilin [Halosimplex litoreum]|uniref:Type IV pilin n=1 Tax=Halosimplex litoreum TaxID=1198301 RepID=A0A7T3G030_9EURY|nr:archaellin/type IV pilin N-terminal domain-containing protein [Halosimplex litoreum]QPV63806.1 type IV pilin [Halosimplex litoreum]
MIRRGGAAAGHLRRRGQSSVVGVALLLGVTVVTLGVLTASVGVLVEDHAARADADRVAADLQSGLRPVESTGHRTTTVRFGGGRLYTAERQLRVSDATGVVANVDIGALVYENGDRRVAAVAGAVVRGRGENAWFAEPPPVVGSESNGVLVVGAANLSANPSSVGGGRVAADLVTNVTHDRRSLGPGRYEVAVETEAPAAFERYFEQRGATVGRTDRDGDGVVSVVAEFPGRRRAYLAEHRMRLEVTNG